MAGLDPTWHRCGLGRHPTVVAGGLLSGGLAVTCLTAPSPSSFPVLSTHCKRWRRRLRTRSLTKDTPASADTTLAAAALPAAASKTGHPVDRSDGQGSRPGRRHRRHNCRVTTAAPTKGASTARPPPQGDTAAPTKGDTAESTTGKTDDTSSDTGATAGTSAKPGTPTSGPKHQAPTGNGANSTVGAATRPGDEADRQAATQRLSTAASTAVSSDSAVEPLHLGGAQLPRPARRGRRS